MMDEDSREKKSRRCTVYKSVLVKWNSDVAASMPSPTPALCLNLPRCRRPSTLPLRCPCLLVPLPLGPQCMSHLFLCPSRFSCKSHHHHHHHHHHQQRQSPNPAQRTHIPPLSLCGCGMNPPRPGECTPSQPPSALPSLVASDGEMPPTCPLPTSKR